MTPAEQVEFLREQFAKGTKYDNIAVKMQFRLPTLEAADALLLEAKKPAPVQEIAPAPKVEVFDPLPGVPEEMKQLAQWLTWNPDGKGKQPFQSGTQIPARTNTPDDLVDYQTAAKNIQQGKGFKHLGFVPTGDILGLDIDACRDPQTGEIAQWANQLLAALPPTYTEITPSETGLRPWLHVPGLDRHKLVFPIDDGVQRGISDKKPQVELLTINYGTITGVSANHSHILATVTLDQWKQIESLLATFRPKDTPATSSDRKVISNLAKTYGIEVTGLMIPYRSHDNSLYSIGCSLRARGFEYEEIEERLIQIADQRCEGRGADYVQMAKKCARQACKQAKGEWAEAFLGSSREAVPTQVLTTDKTLAASAEVDPVVIPKFVYPKFPHWVMKGCNMYDGYIKEVCEKNCRYPEFMFMPGMAILLNYLGTKAKINMLGHINGAMVNLIGKKGKLIKSSSVQDMFNYYEQVGVFRHYNPTLNDVVGTSVAWTAGSTESLGINANRIRCKNMILFYDELKTFADKGSIEGSSMAGHALTMLQSGRFANSVKNPRDSFEFSPNAYTASIITCSTPRMFPKYWTRLIGIADGLKDRATLVYQPEILKPMSVRQHVELSPDTIAREKELIAKAVSISTYKRDDEEMLTDFISKTNIRSEGRAEEWALAFAVQMGKDSVDEACIERGIALEQYNLDVQRFLHVTESETKEAVIQNDVINRLLHSGGSQPLRKLERDCNAQRLGTTLWNHAFNGLTGNGQIGVTGSGKKGDPWTVNLLRVPEDDDD